uniref:Kringle domain-containing protein n=1 Tax=Elaeophora elaphi TaxID=1147741 RepID=A0A0R3RSZ0_9BILA
MCKYFIEDVRYEVDGGKKNGKFLHQIKQLYCRNGKSNIPETRIPTLCPSLSTTCGYFEFEKLSLPGNKEEPLAYYECIDSSILMPDNNDNVDKIKELLFSKYCDDRARCREITLSSFNLKFVQHLTSRFDDRYLNGGVDDKLQRLLTKRIKFCCAINDQLLQKIIHFDDYVLPILAPSEPVICNNIYCRGAPIGCLTYSKFNRTQQSAEIEEDDDVIIVQAMHTNYEDYTIVTSQPTNKRYTMGYATEHHCVYRHFNDEMYRYCLLINDRSSSNNHCYYGDGYQICCCFLHRGDRTCDPLSPKVITQTSTEVSEIIPSQSIVSLHAYNKDVKTKLRTRFTFLSKIPLEKKKLHFSFFFAS